MQKEDERPIPGEGPSWRLSLRAVRFHNSHLQAGKGTGANCSICSEGLGGALAEIKETPKPADKDEVAPSDGDNKEGDSPSSYSDWYSSKGNAD